MKLCKDCKHFNRIYGTDSHGSLEMNVCARKMIEITDPVYGDSELIGYEIFPEAREKNTICGPLGKNWEAKETRQTAPWIANKYARLFLGI